MENKDTKREPNFKKGAIVVYLEYIAQDKRFIVREVGAGNIVTGKQIGRAHV